MSKKGQQEILGFVLIVVLVVVAMMVFLIISVRNTPERSDSLEISNILDAVMKHTTDCAIVYVPDYDNFEDLFESCYDGDDCSNLERSACDYLNETLRDVLGDLMASEGSVNSYELDFFVENGEGLLRISEGNCSGSVSGAQRSILSGDENLVIRLKTCGL